MQVKYYAEDDALIITATSGGRSGGALRDYFGVILTFADEGSKIITRVRVLNATDFLPLDAERGYDVVADALTLGDKPIPPYRTVTNGDFVGYWQEFDDGSDWDIVAVDLLRASIHLAPVLTALPLPSEIPG